MRAFKYRLSPTRQQQAQLQWTLDRCRELYNAALQERKEAYTYAHRSISFAEQCRDLTVIRNEIRDEYQQIGSHVLQNVLHRVDKAYKALFRRIKAGEKPGFPRYQGRDRYESFCFPDHAGWKLSGDRLSITHLGSVKVRLHRALRGTIKTCTVKREGEQWYVVFACEVPESEPLPPTGQETGIDVGLLSLATLADGRVIENPRFLRRSEKKLALANQRLSRCKKRSHRRHKAKAHVARLYRKVRHQRADFLHKASHTLVHEYDLICFEDLAPSKMSKRAKPKQDEDGNYLPNHQAQKSGMNKSILDAGWSQLVQYTTYKAECAGRLVVRVDPDKTSQLCSACDKQGPHKDLSVRIHICPHCGIVLDRDHNAALNILKRGRRLRSGAVEAAGF